MTEKTRADEVTPEMAGVPLTREHVYDIVGEIEDAKVAAILAIGATLEDLEAAVAWAAGESDVMGAARQHASPTIGALYEILTADEDKDDERG